MKSKHKQKNQPTRTPATPPGAAPGSGFGSLRTLLVFALLVTAAGGTWAFMEFVVWNKVPSNLVGKWVVTEGPDEGGTIDFYRNGTMVAVVNLQGKTGIVNAKIRVEDNRIHATLTNALTGQEGTRVQNIKVLTDDRLVLEDEQGNSIKLKRAD